MDYQAQANRIAEQLGIKLTVKSSEYKKHFADDTNYRTVFRCRLSRGRKGYTFYFGQSLTEGSKEPDMYSILSCLQKYDVGDFENFCADFGYDEDSRSAEKIYNAVVKEWQAMERLFDESELELLNEIQ